MVLRDMDGVKIGDQCISKERNVVNPVICAGCGLSLGEFVETYTIGYAALKHKF